MNQISRLLPLCTLSLGLGLGFAWFGTRTHPETAASSASSQAAAPATPAVTRFAPGEPSPSSATDASGPAALVDEPSAKPEPPSTLSDEARARIFEEIETAYTSYEVGALPKLVPYLRHTDPEVRACARDAIVQLGHAEGVAPLRAAARSARDPHEAAALLEAAEFLELPPAPPVDAGTPASVARQSAPSSRGAARLSASAKSL